MNLTEILLAAIILICFYIFVYFYKLKNYWKWKNIPGPKNQLFFGTLHEADNKNELNVMKFMEWTKKYGKTYGTIWGSRKILITSDLDMINDLFVKKFEYFHGRHLHPFIGNVDDYNNVRVNLFNARGNRWKRLRNITNPFFNVVNLKLIHPTVQDSINNLLNLIENKNNQEIDSYKYFQEMTMDIISRIALGQNESKLFENEFLNNVRGFFETKDISYPEKFTFIFPKLIQPLMSILFKLKISRLRFFEDIRQELKNVIKNRKNQRELNNFEIFNDDDKRKIDYIDIFLNLETKNFKNDDNNLFDKHHFKVEKKLTTNEVIALCQVFLLAGYDTTATSIAYVVYELAMNVECQKKLQQELDDNCISEEPSYDDIQKLKYLDAVVKESLRLHPLAARASARECMESTNLGDYYIEKGVFVQVDVFSIHYNKSIWGEDADQFNPDRWLNDEKRHPMAWIPFGAGPRICIGSRLAYLEEKIFLISCLKRFNIVKSQNTPEKLKLFGALVVAPENVPVKFVLRQ